MASEEIYLTRESAERIANAVRVIEKMPRLSDKGRYPPRITSPAMAFKVTTQLSAATSQLAPGHGVGTMLDFDPSTGDLSVGTVTGVKIWSLCEVTIGVGSTVQCLSMYGQWWYDVTQCPNGGT